MAATINMSSYVVDFKIRCPSLENKLALDELPCSILVLARQTVPLVGRSLGQSPLAFILAHLDGRAFELAGVFCVAV
jgi:hypothetical protein